MITTQRIETELADIKDKYLNGVISRNEYLDLLRARAVLYLSDEVKYQAT